jgi:SAM-dependent methyltransferase
MRRLPFAGGERGFAVLLNLFTSFGYFETDAENAAAAREMGRVLRPGGRFAIDLLNAAPTVRALETRSERRAGGFHIREERRHEAARRRLEKRVVLTRLESGETKEYHESVRLYRPEEIDAVLAAAGLRVERLLGDFSGSPYSEDAPRMLLLGRRA